MSRIGKKQIVLPDKVEIDVRNGSEVSVKGPKGQLTFTLPSGLGIEIDGSNVTLVRHSEEREVRAMHGTARSLVANMVEGVVNGFSKDLEIIGVGFRAAVKGKDLDLSLGFSHPVLHPIPDGLSVTVEGNTNIKVQGIDKQLVGQFAADVRSYYPPEPYKGKGVRYKGEKVRRKQGKSVKR
jgi:large subunit ribosomal protein L6